MDADRGGHWRHARTTVAAAAMLVATVVSMWALSAMAVTVRHGRSRMARWAQQQRNDAPPDKAAAMAVPGDAGVHDPGGGDGAGAGAGVVGSYDPGGGGGGAAPSLPPSLLNAVPAVGGAGGGSGGGGGGGGGAKQKQHFYHRDKANELLHVVESQQQLGGNCTAGTDLNMGEGVVDRYAQVSVVAFQLIRSDPYELVLYRITR